MVWTMNKFFMTSFFIGASLPAFADGSISGGGGGTLPLHPAGRHAVMEILRWAPAELTMFLNHQYNRDGEWLDARLFAADKNIFAVIRDTKIAVKMDGPCLTANGTEVDGSTSGPVASSICMSAKTIGGKLDKYSVHAQTVALLAHEYSHLLGFSEADADKLQSAVIYYLSEVNEDWYGRIPSFAFVIDSFDNRLVDLRMLVNTMMSVSNWNHSCLVSREMLNSSTKVLDEVDKRQLSTVSGTHLDLYDQIWTKILGLKAASCGRAEPGTEAEYDDEVFAAYIKAFGERQELTTREFDKEFSGATLIDDSNPFKMRRIDTPADAAKEAGDLFDLYTMMINHMNVLRTPAELIEY